MSREAILAAALTTWSGQSYDATSVRDIADQAGVTAAALYYHFDGKDDLLAVLVEPYLARLELLTGSESTQVELADVVTAYLDLLLANPRLTRLVDRDPAVRTHPQLGPRLATAQRALLNRLLPGPTEADLVRTTAALGVLRRPVRNLDRAVVQRHRRILERAALVLLSGPDPDGGAGREPS